MKSFAVPVADTPECARLLDVAFALAQRQEGRVRGYHMVPEPTPEDYQVDPATLWTSSGIGSQWLGLDEASIAARAAAARALFVERAQAHGFTGDGPAAGRAIYVDRRGLPEDVIPRIGPASDLLLVSRAPRRGGLKAWAVMLSAVMDSVTPVLVMPQHKRELKLSRIMVCWNNGPAEAQLIRAAVPLLRQAKSVRLVTVGKPSDRGTTVTAMLDYLDDHGISAKSEQLEKGKEGKALAKAAEAMKADLILSGAYTRGRMREMVLGGVTEYLLTRTELPCLLLHR